MAPVPARHRLRRDRLSRHLHTAAYIADGTLQRESGTIDVILGAAAVAAIVAMLLIVRRQTGKLAGRAEAAYPGPLA